MAARGHTVLVITSSDRPNPYSTQHENLSTVRLRSFRNPLRIGQRLPIWPRREVLRALHEFSPDILHVSDPIQFALPALEYSGRKRIPRLYSIQQLPWFLTSYLPKIQWLKDLLEGILWMYGKWLIRQFDAVTVPTRTVARIVESRTNVSPYVISNGVDLELFKPATGNHSNGVLRKKLAIPLSAPIILHVGRLDADKQVDAAIRASAISLKQTGAHLLMVGDGRERSRLTRVCEELGIASKSHFTGFVSPAEGLADIYRLATVFVITSQIETQGIVLLEAAASGIPIVAVDATCIPEIVAHNANGFLVPPGQPEIMGHLIMKIVQDPERARVMGLTGRNIVLKHSIEKSMDIWESLFIRCQSLAEKWNQPGVADRSLTREY
jgi:glycosyltransferase involved in cell wall biosynthesis